MSHARPGGPVAPPGERPFPADEENAVADARPNGFVAAGAGPRGAGRGTVVRQGCPRTWQGGKLRLAS
ncbi:hypothetical protein [Streptomyces uncialis]|uniref:hypothetical protein n=1 Tax=Streptomyces uncialis TaxID=1048205 RepID=UPI003869790D|nr:hypothetical protein OG268_36025 [Streptomyces uncialis]